MMNTTVRAGALAVMLLAPTSLTAQESPIGISGSTFIGGRGIEGDGTMAVDAAGNRYIAAFSDDSFPTTAGACDRTVGGITEMTLTKVASNGTLVWSTFLGGSGSEEAAGVAVDAAGDVYVCGATTPTQFPAAVQRADTFADGAEWYGFLAKISADGSHLLWTTNLGENVFPMKMARGGDGHLFIVGRTTSKNMPGSADGFDDTLNGGMDGFVMKVAPDGSAIRWSAYVGGPDVPAIGGGTQLDYPCSDVAVDAAGNCYVAGSTASAAAPVTVGAFQATFVDVVAEPGQGYVMKVGPTGTLTWATFIGGSGRDGASAVAVDAAGFVIVGGFTESQDYPTMAPCQANRSGASDGFVAKLAPDGSRLIWSTYFGGSGDETIKSVALSGCSVYLGGMTTSLDGMPGDDQRIYGPAGGIDGFVARIDQDQLTVEAASLAFTTTSGSDVIASHVLGLSGLSVAWSTYLAGGGDDYVEKIAVTPGTVSFYGWTMSADYPLSGAFDSTFEDKTELMLTTLEDRAESRGWPVVTWEVPDAPAWLMVAAGGVATAPSLVVSVDSEHLEAGTYAAVIHLKKNGVLGPTVTVSLKVNPPIEAGGTGSGDSGGGGGGGCSAAGGAGLLIGLLAFATLRRN